MKKCKCEPEDRCAVSREIPVGPLIHKTDKRLSRNLSARVRAAGLDEITVMHGWIIRYLYNRQGENIFQKDIEKFFSIGRSTVTNIIQLMEKKGFVTRESVASDARLKRVRLTEKGIESHKMFEELTCEIDRELIRGITEKELDAFYTVMKKINGNLNEKQDAGEEDEHASCVTEGS